MATQTTNESPTVMSVQTRLETHAGQSFGSPLTRAVQYYFFRPPCLRGTFAPERRASERPMAIA